MTKNIQAPFCNVSGDFSELWEGCVLIRGMFIKTNAYINTSETPESLKISNVIFFRNNNKHKRQFLAGNVKTTKKNTVLMHKLNEFTKTAAVQNAEINRHQEQSRIRH